MYTIEARAYITRLIGIQRRIWKDGYRRGDQQTVNECLVKVEILLKTWKYGSDELMAGFWIHHREEIRYLIPTTSYKGFKALMIHFECLDKDSLKWRKEVRVRQFQNQ